MSESMSIRLLNSAISEFSKSYTGYSESEIFELFSADCALRSYSLDDTQLELGRVGEGTDGGIDWIYLVINGDVIDLNEPLEDFAVTRNSEVVLIIGQSKRQQGWKAAVGANFLSTFSDLFGSQDGTTIRTYSEDLRARVSNFTDFWMRAAGKRPQFSIRVVYASKAPAQTPHVDVVNQLELALDELRKQFKSAVVAGEFLGADALFELASSTPSYDADLEYQEELEKGNDKIALVLLSDYAKFLSNENGELNEHFFEGNVRHFEGEVNVNKQIRETLENSNSDTDFWWLNNGITMLVSEAPVSRKKRYTLNDVQIVNGLQTSYSIFRWANNNPHAAEDDRCLLIRIIAPNSEAEKSAIIRATNSQTPVEISSLRATDDIHRAIEDVLKLEGIYYDRRKNFHKNQGRKAKDIISIRLLSQAMMSAFLGRPDTARARPSSFLQKEETYQEIFDNREMEDFLWAAKVQKLVDHTLQEVQEYTTPERNNLRFYVLYTMRILGSNIQKSKTEWDNSACPNSWIPQPEQIITAAQWVQDIANDMKPPTTVSLDPIFKSSTLLTKLEKSWLTDSPLAEKC